MPIGTGAVTRMQFAVAPCFVRCDQLTQTYTLYAAQDSGHPTRTTAINQALPVLGGNRKLLNPFFKDRTTHDLVLEHRLTNGQSLSQPAASFEVAR